MAWTFWHWSKCKVDENQFSPDGKVYQEKTSWSVEFEENKGWKINRIEFDEKLETFIFRLQKQIDYDIWHVNWRRNFCDEHGFLKEEYQEKFREEIEV